MKFSPRTRRCFLAMASYWLAVGVFSAYAEVFLERVNFPYQSAVFSAYAEVFLEAMIKAGYYEGFLRVRGGVSHDRIS